MNVKQNKSNRGRPPKYVYRYVKRKKRLIVGLSKKTDGRFYTTHNDPITGKRIYFGYDRTKAIKLFFEWNEQKKIA